MSDGEATEFAASASDALNDFVSQDYPEIPISAFTVASSTPTDVLYIVKVGLSVEAQVEFEFVTNANGSGWVFAGSYVCNDLIVPPRADAVVVP